MRTFSKLAATLGLTLLALPVWAGGTIAVKGETVYTLAGDAIVDGVVLVENGRIAAVGTAADVVIPPGVEVRSAKVVTPGLIDAHSVVGLAGYLNQRQDQDQLDGSSPSQPELRAIDAYDVHEPLVDWIRSFGVTTVHTGHGPGALISGQTMITKTRGASVEEAVIVPTAMVAATLGEGATEDDGKAPGTRSKAAAMLRADLIEARAYSVRQAKDRADDDEEADPRPARDLKLETLAQVMAGELPLMITVQRHQDIATALRIQRELGFRLVLDGAAEAYLLVDEIRAAGVPVIVHPTMARASGEMENMSMETAATLADAGIAVALQSGFESYVPKTRVALFEAGIAAAFGLGFERALGSITIEAARILGVDDRVGSIEVGKDGDLALYDGDPFEYTSHCIGVVIEGEVVSEGAR